MAIPRSNISLRAAREDLSLSPTGGLKVTEAFRRFENYDNSGPISLKGDLGGTCMGMQPYTGENLLTGGTADWKKDERCGMRNQCFGDKQDSAAQIASTACVQGPRWDGFSTQITVVHKSLYSNECGYITRHWAYCPDGGSITLEYRVNYIEQDGGLTALKPQVEIVGYADGWASGSQSMLGHNEKGKSNTDYTLGPFDTTGYPYVMIAMSLFTGGRNDNFQKSAMVPYTNVRATITW